MSFRVIKPGLLTTIQDLGRWGFQQHGVIVSGAMDSYSLRIANWLVGNQEDEAVLEITLIGPTLRIEEDCLLAITGGHLSPTIDGKPVPMWRPVYVQKGRILEFGQCQSGCRSYLAVAGGYIIPEVMNSKSTYLRGEIGGYKGRALQVNDVIACYKPSSLSTHWSKNTTIEPFTTTNWSVHYQDFISFQENPIIRVIKGSQYDHFTDSSKNELIEQSFFITNQSDRMGYRLSGPNMKLQKQRSLLSEAVSNGSIQVPPDGNPIILLADHQTTGGYPKIAQMISVDLPLIGQVKPGEAIHFSLITLEKAEHLYLQKEQQLKELKIAISLKGCVK